MCRYIAHRGCMRWSLYFIWLCNALLCSFFFFLYVYLSSFSLFVFSHLLKLPLNSNLLKSCFCQPSVVLFLTLLQWCALQGVSVIYGIASPNNTYLKKKKLSCCKCLVRKTVVSFSFHPAIYVLKFFFKIYSTSTY